MTPELMQQKEKIIDIMRTGVPEQAAIRCALLSEEEQEQILNDPSYQREKEYVYATLESELVAGLYKAALAGCEHGNASAAERLLEIINPRQYSKKAQLDVKSAEKPIGQITVNYV